MIKLTNINKYFISNNKRIDVLKNVNIQFPDHGLISIVGKSGSGKTTLLNIISGLLKPDEGEYLLLNKDTSSFNNNDWCKIRGKYFSYVFQNYNLIDKLTLIDNLKLAALNNEIEISEEEIDNVLEQYGILDLKNKPIYELSGGEAQRCAIVRSIIANSKIVLADEPTGALDEENAVNVFESLKELGKTKLVIVVTHDTDFAYKYSDSIIKISYGNIVENTIISGENSGNDLEIIDDNFSLKRAKKFSKIVLKKDKRKLILSISLFSIIMSLIMFSCHILFFDADRYAYEIISKTDNRVYISYGYDINQSSSIRKNDVAITDDVILEYNLKPIYFSLFGGSINLLTAGKYSGEIFDNILINDSLNDGEIIVSDYILNRLKSCELLNFEDPLEVEGKEISLGNINLLVKEVNVYGANEYASGIYFSATSDLVEMNEKTLKLLYNFFNTNKIDNVYFYNYIELGFTSNFGNPFVGSKTLENKQIAISAFLLSKYLNEFDSYEFDCDTFMNNHINTNIELTINGVTDIYEVAAIFTGGRESLSEVILSSDVYNNFFNYENISFENFPRCYYSDTLTYDEYLSISNFSKNLNVIRPVTYTYILEASSICSTIEGSFKPIARVLFIIIAIIYLIFSFLSNKTFLSLSKRNISILYFLGYDKKWIKTCYHGNNIDTNIISFIIGFVLSILLIFIFNNSILSVSSLLGINYNWLIIVLSFLAFIILSFVILEMLLRVLFKKSMLLIMKGK